MFRLKATNFIILIQLKRLGMHDLEGKIAELGSYSNQVRTSFSKLSIPKLVPRKVRTILVVAPPPSQETGLKYNEEEIDLEEPQRRWSKEEEEEIGMEQCFKNDEDREQALGNSVQDLRVNKKTSKKGKRDGQNIRTYARYDSLIQTLEEELSFHRIYTKNIDQNLFDHFDMKSKRSLERYFFYLCLAKRENKLTPIIPELRIKTKKKVIQKGGHRTTEFLETLQGCIDCYIVSAEMLDQAKNQSEAREAFKHAYLYDENESMRVKRPHHNQVKGIQKCMRIYHQIIYKNDSEYLVKDEPLKDQQMGEGICKEYGQFLKIPELPHIKTADQENPEFCHTLFVSRQEETSPKKQYFCLKKSQQEFESEENQISEREENGKSEKEEKQELDGSKQSKKKASGIKNKKQDDRDIQKYAKFDIVSESSLEFCKFHKIYKLIPENTRKLSQRSLHFFFVILAFIERQDLQAEFVSHMENDYEKKIDKRYTQRSPYFREQLKKSFRNLVDSAKLLFEGKLQEALETAYEVHPEKRTHPAKANQLLKCNEIYKETIENLKLPATNDKIQEFGVEEERK